MRERGVVVVLEEEVMVGHEVSNEVEECGGVWRRRRRREEFIWSFKKGRRNLFGVLNAKGMRGAFTRQAVDRYNQLLFGLPVQGEEEARLLRVQGLGFGWSCLVGRGEEA